MRPSNPGRRTVAAAAFAACLLVAGPAAYAAGAATADGDEPAVGNVAGAEPGVTGSGGHDHSGPADQDQEPGPSGEPDPPDGAGGSGSSGAAESPADTGAPESPGQEEDGDGADGGDDAPGGGDGPDQARRSALDVLASDCTGSTLAPHDGFQKAPRCVSTAFGEVAAAERSPSLLITESPDRVAPGQEFTLKVSTRNLVRDRFLSAAQGGYYVEASLLDGEGLQRGHFHTACRMLPDPREAPDAAPEPLFFEATEDGGGGAAPDEVTLQVPGIEARGELQCTSWAGDGSHRTPMMQRANQTPAFDSVRIEVG